MEDKKPTFRPGPLAPKEAEEWLSWLENIVTIERDAAFAYSFVLHNLFGLLARSKLIDGHAFIGALRTKVPQIEGPNYRIAIDSVLNDLTRVLPPLAAESKDLH